ncbi:MAG: hypothetical protein H6870_13440 [Methylobacteriaceae bacterium]|nr:hypothetical protein [Methylobacteriaceae bacterium]
MRSESSDSRVRQERDAGEVDRQGGQRGRSHIHQRDHRADAIRRTAGLSGAPSDGVVADILQCVDHANPSTQKIAAARSEERRQGREPNTAAQPHQPPGEGQPKHRRSHEVIHVSEGIGDDPGQGVKAIEKPLKHSSTAGPTRRPGARNALRLPGASRSGRGTSRVQPTQADFAVDEIVMGRARTPLNGADRTAANYRPCEAHTPETALASANSITAGQEKGAAADRASIRASWT